jgi:hypothetical protein
MRMTSWTNLLALVAVASCSTGTISDITPTVASISVQLNASNIPVAGQAQATAIVRDANGAILDREVSWSSNSNAVTVSATGGVTGVAIGLASITASADGESGSASLSVVAPPATGASQLAVSRQAAGAVDGAAFTTQPTVQLRDAAGAVVATSSAAVTAALASGTGTLGGTLTVSAVSGVARFTDLRITGTGAHTLSFTSAGIPSVSSSSFVVAAAAPPPPAAATQLAVTRQPAGAVDGAAFTTQPLVQVRDAAGVVVAGASAAVTASIASGPGTLGGTLTVTAVNGVATFTDLRITGTGAHTLRFSATGLTAATSASVSVTVAQAPPPPPPGGYKAPDIAFHDFNNGGWGPFTNETPGHVSIIDDPTGSGRGKVVKINYSQSGGGQIDLNQYFGSPVGPAGFGTTFYAAGDVYFPASTKNFTNTGVLRKLMYFRLTDAGTGQTTNLVLLMWGNGLMINWSGPMGSINADPNIGTLTAGQWARVEMRTTINTAAARADGIIQLWVNGVLTYTATDVQLTGSGWRTLGWDTWWVGHQREGTGGETAVDEDRYWDNVAFSSSRIGP